MLMFTPQENSRRRAMLMQFQADKPRTSDRVILVLGALIIGILFATGEFHSIYGAISW